MEVKNIAGTVKRTNEEMKDCDVIETQPNHNCDITNQQQIIKKNKPNLTIIIPTEDYDCDEKIHYKMIVYLIMMTFLKMIVNLWKLICLKTHSDEIHI